VNIRFRIAALMTLRSSRNIALRNEMTHNQEIEVTEEHVELREN